jgi:hypothetical protein
VETLADSQEAAERQQGVAHLARHLVDREIVEVADTFARQVEHRSSVHPIAGDQVMIGRLRGHFGPPC